MTEIAVVGAGLMGHALALVFALGGHQVRLTDTSADKANTPARCLFFKPDTLLIATS